VDPEGGLGEVVELDGGGQWEVWVTGPEVFEPPGRVGEAGVKILMEQSY